MVAFKVSRVQFRERRFSLSKLLIGRAMRAIQSQKGRLVIKRTREADASVETKTSPSQGTLRGLDWLNFLLADVQTALCPCS
jgi:hypothetical protein